MGDEMTEEERELFFNALCDRTIFINPNKRYLVRNITSRNKYIIKRDFDGYLQENFVRELVGYAENEKKAAL